MRLVALDRSLVEQLATLRIPLDRVTPGGLWGTACQLVGLEAPQLEVLQRWGIALEEITPALLRQDADTVAATQAEAAEPPRVEAQPADAAHDEDEPSPATASVVTIDREVPISRATPRLRVSVSGKYLEGTLADGKVLLKGRTFDSLEAATTALGPERARAALWEYFDENDGKWRMLDSDSASLAGISSPTYAS